MNGLAKGTRISYRQYQGRSTIRAGTVVGEATVLGARYYRVRNDASGRIVNVLPQHVTRIY